MARHIPPTPRPGPGSRESIVLEDLGEPRYSPWMAELIAAADRARAAASATPAAGPAAADSPPAANLPAAE